MMASTKSYQRRKHEIKYLEQCVKELEDLCFFLAKQLGPKASIPLLGADIAGNHYITPYNNGDFALRLSSFRPPSDPASHSPSA